MFACCQCSYKSKKRYNVVRHERVMHGSDGENLIFKLGNSNCYMNDETMNSIVNGETFDIRLKENFKLFVSGPSRCGKTVFVSKLIENIKSFAKQPPGSIIYVY